MLQAREQWVRLCDKNRLIDSTEHTLFQKWAARDRDPV